MLAETVREAAERFGARPAIVTEEGWSLTYADLDRLSDEAAAGLFATGVREGDVVATVLPPSPEHFVAYLGAAKLGFELQGAGGLDIEGPGPNRWVDFDFEQFGERAVDASLVTPFADGSWGVTYLRSFSGTIAGGTSEIQRNIVAERVLGLPRG